MSIYSRKNPPTGFYVYAYIRSKDSETAKAGTPYYIGKGKDKRAWDEHIVPVPKESHRIVIIEQNLTEVGALAIERRMIRWYGRKDLKTGILHNRTDGGDGASGYIKTEEHIRKIADSNRGKTRSIEACENISKGLIGKKHSLAHRLNNSKAQTGKKQTIETKFKRQETRKKRGIRSLPETMAKMNLASRSENARIKRSATLSGHAVHEETKNKISNTLKNKPKIRCEYCGKEFDTRNYNRWHGLNCKSSRNSE
jgi:hypothetical protein